MRTQKFPDSSCGYELILVQSAGVSSGNPMAPAPSSVGWWIHLGMAFLVLWGGESV